jgi:secreted trypsin-like serine protease
MVSNKQIGYTVGWGVTDDVDVPSNLKKASLSIVSFEDCLKSISFDDSFSFNHFCAIDQASKSINNYDSGGGIFLQKGEIWYLFGIASNLHVRDDSRPLDYEVLVNVSKYDKWVKKHLKIGEFFSKFE